MTDRPILMSAPMVRAILDGTKTQTRRVVKITHRTPGLAACLLPPAGLRTRPSVAAELCPYGRPGDRLWVRETWRVRGGREYEYQQAPADVMYLATHQEDGFPLTWESYDWRPSIHMPRWASRITLEVTGVRVERLQDISEADALAEGVQDEKSMVLGPKGQEITGPIAEYAVLWEQINGDGSWDLNPWVWCVSFRRVTP